MKLSDQLIELIELLTVPTGNGQGKPFVLQAFQKDFIRAVYDPVGPDGNRKIRRAILSMARKNGKSALIAALVICHLIGPVAIQNGVIISAANSQEQASEVFTLVKQIIEADPELLAMFEVQKHAIRAIANNSIYRAIGADKHNAHGKNPSVVIYDELAQSKSPDFYYALETSQGARRTTGALMLIISTQASDPAHVLSEMIDDGIATPDGPVHVSLYAAPDGCDPRDPAAWDAGNPGLGTINFEDMPELSARAVRTTSFEPFFRNLHLNQRVSPFSPFIAAKKWGEAGDDACALRPGEDIYLGLDLSKTIDLTALVAVSAGRDETRCAAWFWKPANTLMDHQTRDHRPYVTWVEKGYLNTTPGETVDYAYIAAKIGELSQTYNIVGLAYDRHYFDILKNELIRLGVPCQEGKGSGVRIEPFGQGTKSMTPAIVGLEVEIAAGRFSHPKHPILTWNVLNAIAITDPAGGRKLDKSKSTQRIDGAVSLVMASGLKTSDLGPIRPVHVDPWADPNFSVWN